MPTFKDLKSLNVYLQKQVQEVMEKEVSETVKDVMQEHIQKDVYDKYEPKRYQRLEHNGGLIDRDNIESRPIRNGIEVENVTYHDGKYIPLVIETGEGYTYEGYGYAYEKPRPFIAETKKDLNKNKQHVQTLKKGLKKKGFKVE